MNKPVAVQVSSTDNGPESSGGVEGDHDGMGFFLLHIKCANYLVRNKSEKIKAYTIF